MSVCPTCGTDGLLWVLSHRDRPPALIHPPDDPTGGLVLALLHGVTVALTPAEAAARAPDLTAVSHHHVHVCGVDRPPSGETRQEVLL